MKFKIVILISYIIISFCSVQNSYALPTELPQNHAAHLTEEELNNQTTNIITGFFTGLIKVLRGDTKDIPIKSKDIKTLSSTMKSYEEQESLNNSSFKNSHSEEKFDFGIAVLDIIAGILSFFGI